MYLLKLLFLTCGFITVISLKNQQYHVPYMVLRAKTQYFSIFFYGTRVVSMTCWQDSYGEKDIRFLQI